MAQDEAGRSIYLRIEPDNLTNIESYKIETGLIHVSLNALVNSAVRQYLVSKVGGEEKFQEIYQAELQAVEANQESPDNNASSD